MKCRLRGCPKTAHRLSRLLLSWPLFLGGAMSERRIAMLVDPSLSGLPAFLTPSPGLNSGFMVPQVTAAALVSENRQRATPASVDSVPTCANQEDHVSMSAHAARRLLPMADNTASIVGIELLAAAQGCDFLAPLTSSASLEQVRARLRAEVPGLRRTDFLPLISPARRHLSAQERLRRPSRTLSACPASRIDREPHEPRCQCPHNPCPARQ